MNPHDGTFYARSGPNGVVQYAHRRVHPHLSIAPMIAISVWRYPVSVILAFAGPVATPLPAEAQEDRT